MVRAVSDSGPIIHLAEVSLCISRGYDLFFTDDADARDVGELYSIEVHGTAGIIAIFTIKLKEILERLTEKLEDRIKIPEFKLDVAWLRNETQGRITTSSIFRNNSPFPFKPEYINMSMRRCGKK